MICIGTNTSEWKKRPGYPPNEPNPGVLRTSYASSVPRQKAVISDQVIPPTLEQL